MGTHPVTAIIVNFNAGALLATALDGLGHQGVGHVVVVDNASWDGSAETAARPGIDLVRSSLNIGFARAVNLALARDDAPFVLLLNADVDLDDGYVERLVAALSSDDSLAGVTGVLRLPSGAIDSTGIAMSSARWAWDRDRGMTGADVTAGEPFGVSGAACLLRRSALDGLGADPLWSELFVYWEDVELAWRLRRAGWRFATVAGATAAHARGSDSAAPDFVEAASLGGRLATVARHEGLPGLWRPGPLAITLTIMVRLALRHPRALLRARPVAMVAAGLRARRVDRARAWSTLDPAVFTPHPWRRWFAAQGGRARTLEAPRTELR
ncbi:MAG TPA: glycosyltransferase family 2 protein [Acidimicrobiales bacterium]|nr:glycosyltransferase family 2 protein [Acidimicrobiales bacterium]